MYLECDKPYESHSGCKHPWLFVYIGPIGAKLIFAVGLKAKAGARAPQYPSKNPRMSTIKVKPIAILTSPIGYSSHHTSHYFPNTPSSPLLLQPSTMQRWSQGHNFRAQSHSKVHSQSASRPRPWPRGLSATTYHILKYFLKFIISILSQTIFHNAINYP